MRATLLARLSELARRAPRRSAGALAAIALVIGAFGAAGAHALRADTLSPLPSPTPAPSTSPLPDTNAGPKNIVQVKNFMDGNLRVEGRVQLGRVPGPEAGPVNLALALSSCTDCQTLAVALQINLINSDASVIAPKNAAVAVNGGCTRCETVALALQYNIGVSDPIYVPPEVDQLVAQMKHELAVATSQAASLAEAEADINVVLGQFVDLSDSLILSRDQAVSPGPPAASPAPATSAPESPTPSASPDSSPSPADSPSPSPSPSPSSSSPASPVSELPRRNEF